MLTTEATVDEIIKDVLDSRRYLMVEDAVDEIILAERDILTEATTTADKMVDLSIDADYDDESNYLDEDHELNDFLDSHIDEFITGEDDLFQDTLDDCDFYDEDIIEDVEDVLCPYDDIEALLDDGIDIDSMIENDPDTDY